MFEHSVLRLGKWRHATILSMQISASKRARSSSMNKTKHCSNFGASFSVWFMRKNCRFRCEIDENKRHVVARRERKKWESGRWRPLSRRRELDSAFRELRASPGKWTHSSLIRGRNTKKRQPKWSQLFDCINCTWFKVKINWIWCENEREFWWLIFCFCCCQRSFRFRIGFSRRGINFSRHFVRRLILEFSRWNQQKSIDDKILHVMTNDLHQVTN